MGAAEPASFDTAGETIRTNHSEIAAMIAGVSVLLLFSLAVIVSVISTVANILLARPLRAAFGFEIDDATATATATATAETKSKRGD
jgi:membrane protein implicated in regulation of membrane protease activity